MTPRPLRSCSWLSRSELVRARRGLFLSRWLSFATSLFAPSLAGCTHSHPAASYGLVVRVDGEVGHPLAGATVSFLGQKVGQTGDAGMVRLSVRGSEGEHITLKIACPDGFQSPAKLVDVVLHHLSEAGRRPEYDLQCPPVTRSMVVVVRADRGPHLPVLYLGKEVGRTDESGAAHALVRVPAGEDLEVTLSTSEPGNEHLRPQNPTIKFIAFDPEDVKVFNVKFGVEPEKRAAAQGRPLPVRLN